MVLAHRQGLLRCAGLTGRGAAGGGGRPPGPGSFPASVWGCISPSLRVGLFYPPKSFPHLVDAQGRFGNRPVAVGWRYFYYPRPLPEIRRELAAQIETVLELGLSPGT